MKFGSEKTNLLLELPIDVIKGVRKKEKINEEEMYEKKKEIKEKRLYLKYNAYNYRFRIYCYNVSRKRNLNND